MVLDSTCLIGFERIGKLELLPTLFEPILIPPAVYAEFAKPNQWLLVDQRFDASLASVLRMALGAGESEAIALAKQLNIRFATDDRQARAAAQQLGLRIVGTVGILLRAKSAGVVNAITPLLDALDQSGFRIGQTLRDEAIRVANEDG